MKLLLFWILATFLAGGGVNEVRAIEEQDASGRPTATVIFGDGIDEIVAVEKGHRRYFYHENSLGSIVALTNQEGHVIERYEYEAYGKPTIRSADGEGRKKRSVIGNHILFTGREFDAETGLYRSRAYDPTLGRFLQRDPLELDANLYSYATDNPLRYVDPFGTEVKQTQAWVMVKAKQRAERIRWLEDKLRGNPDSYQLFDSRVELERLRGNLEFERQWDRAIAGNLDDLAGDILSAGEVIASLYPPTAAIMTIDDISRNGLNVSNVLNLGPLKAVSKLGRVLKTEVAVKVESAVVRGQSGITARVTSGELPIRGFRGSKGPNLYHGLDRAIERGVSPRAMLDTVKNPTIIFEQGGGRTLYLTEQAAVVLDSNGQVVTVWGVAQHIPKTLERLRSGGQK